MARLLGIFLATWLVLLGGCGFQLRGDAQLPFTSAYVDVPPLRGGGNQTRHKAHSVSELAISLRQALEAQGKLAASPSTAEVKIHIVDERREKNILSLSGGGKVREYRIIYKVTLKVMDANDKELIAPVELQQTREFTYDDALILAKEAEEESLNRAMTQEALRQVLRRLSYVKR